MTRMLADRRRWRSLGFRRFAIAVVGVLGYATSGLCIAQENIDPAADGSRYAYAGDAGWLNAKPLGDGGPGVEVEDATVTGYLWSGNAGWVSLSCLNRGTCASVSYSVVNDGSGNLTGYAWGENFGWISFSCANTGSCGRVSYGVTIDEATGTFQGHAWSENLGWVTFASSGQVVYQVQTAWPGGLLQFETPTYAVAESGGSATITITRRGGHRGAVGIHYATGDGTAVEPFDYAATSGTVSFDDADLAPKSFTVPIVNDALAEGSETVGLALSAPTGGAWAGSPGSATLTILDNPGTIQFSSAALSVSEASPSATITVTRTGGAGGFAFASYATSDGTATAGLDYLVTSGSLLFLDGDVTPKTIAVPILEDFIYEGSETVNIALAGGGTTGGGPLGAPSAAVLTIVDDEVPTNESIDPNDDGSQYAYAENAGWLNAEPLGNAGPGIVVGTDALTGYAWGENIGWVSLSCSNTGSCGRVSYGVAISSGASGSGGLSGYAWSENAGWISFSCGNTGSCGAVSYGVTIDPASGNFLGRAWSENLGWITLSSGPADPQAYRMRAGCLDADGDGYGRGASFLCAGGATADCNDADPQAWATPGAIGNLFLDHDILSGITTITWSAPAIPGGTLVLYDTIRSQNPRDFVNNSICVESKDGPNTVATDTAIPPAGSANLYYVRSGNSCPTMAAGPGGRPARSCP
jgi:hypothetical protein